MSAANERASQKECDAPGATMPRTLVIDVNKNLPLRARSLADDELQNVFGGCTGNRAVCRMTYQGKVIIDQSCCAGMFCWAGLSANPVSMTAYCRWPSEL
jgi:hypothetical protein